MKGSQTKVNVKRIEPAYLQVAGQLRSLVLEGDLNPGDKLPNEADLSELFGVSRSTVREALRVLSSQNLIRTQRGVTGGSFVAHPDPDDVSDFLEASFGLLTGTSAVSVADLLEARRLLECPVAALAATRHTEQQAAAMSASVQSERAALTDGSGERDPHDFEGHRAFHTGLLDAGGNQLVEILTRPIFATLRTRFLRDRAAKEFWQQVSDDHEEILQRVLARDAEGASQAMSDHLGRLSDTYVAIDKLRTQDGPSHPESTTRAGSDGADPA